MKKHHKTIVAIVDSGIGGVSVLNKIIGKYGCGNFIYLADNLFMPYGNKSESCLKDRVLFLIDYLKRTYSVDYVIIACNTASTIINRLRLKNVFCLNFNKNETYLATNLTKKNLIGYKVISDKNLASLIENNIENKERMSAIIKQTVKRHNLANIARFTLGCTHYELVECLFRKYCKNSEIVCNSSWLINKLKLKNLPKEINISVLVTKKDIELEKRIHKLIVKPATSFC